VVDSYNELITNVDAQLAKTGNLSDQTSLKYLRNRIRSIMTSSSGIAGLAFTNLSSIGISTSAASSGNISTTGLDQLYFDKDKFMQAYNAERGDLEKLLVGADESGILSRLETVVESALTSVSGYFYTTENSFAKQITKLNERISKQNKAVATYQSRLENKFSNMDLLISQIQNQYSSFLGT